MMVGCRICRALILVSREFCSGGWSSPCRAYSDLAEGLGGGLTHRGGLQRNLEARLTYGYGCTAAQSCTLTETRTGPRVAINPCTSKLTDNAVETCRCCYRGMSRD